MLPIPLTHNRTRRIPLGEETADQNSSDRSEALFSCLLCVFEDRIAAMIHKFQEREDYNDFDPVPYQGGYDQAASYGALKPADKECGYRRSQFGVEAPVAQYGNERNPYARGHPGPSIFGGSPKPGAVYGGGRDRTQPSPKVAQPDKAVKTGSGRRKSANGKQPEPINSKPPHIHEEEDAGHNKPRANYDYEVSEESGYRKLKSTYDQEEQLEPPFSYAKAAGYRQPYFGYGEAESGNHHKSKPTFSEVDQYGYRSLFYGYGEAESGYSNSYYGYTEEDSGYRKPQPTYNDEASVYRKPHNEEEESKPGPIFGEQEMPFGRGPGDEGAYSGFGYGYGHQPNYGEETHGSGHAGYGGYWQKFADDDPARFGGGSAYVEERVQNPPAPAPANRSSWW